jgi:hypothetical protein
MNARAGAGFASFEDRLTMVVAGEFLRGAVDDMNNAGEPLTGTNYGKSVMVLVRGLVEARVASHWERYGGTLARALQELKPFLENPRNAIPYMAYFAGQLANLEECLPALLVAQSISDHMARQTPVSMNREIVQAVLKDIETAFSVDVARRGVALPPEGDEQPA